MTYGAVYHEAVPYHVREWVGRWGWILPLEQTFPMTIGTGARPFFWLRLTFRWCGKRVRHWRRPRKRAR